MAKAAVSAFQQAARKAKAAFDAARNNERRTGGGYTLPDIKDGQYIAKVSKVEFGLVEKGNDEGKPFCRVSVVVQDHPEYNGVKLSQYIVIKETAKRTEEDCFNQILDCFAGMGYDTSDVTLDSLEVFGSEVENEAPTIRIGVKNNTYAGPDGKERRALNIYFNGPAESSSKPAESDEEEASEDPNDGLDEDSEDEEWTPSVGDDVLYQAAGSKKPTVWSVKKTYPRKQTADLADKKGNQANNIGWDDLQPV